jgi:hypothetical protein
MFAQHPVSCTQFIDSFPFEMVLVATAATS